MNDSEDKLTDLEIRITHQEASIDELTKVVLKQEEIINLLLGELKNIKQSLKEMPGATTGDNANDIPPHY